MDDFDPVSFLMGQKSGGGGGDGRIIKVSVDTAEKTLNTAYTEALPTGWLSKDTAIAWVNYHVFDNVYSSLSLAVDSGLQFNVLLLPTNEIQYTCKGNFTNRGILDIFLYHLDAAQAEADSE